MRSQILTIFGKRKKLSLIVAVFVCVLPIALWIFEPEEEPGVNQAVYRQVGNCADNTDLKEIVGGDSVTKAMAPTYRAPGQWTLSDTQAADERVYLVSREIYQGWRVYQAFCYACHSTDGFGQTSSLKVSGAHRPAPSLFSFICNSDKKEFLNKVLEGGSGMPSWRHNKLVNNHINELYSYLVAVMTNKIAYAERVQRNPLMVKILVKPVGD